MTWQLIKDAILGKEQDFTIFLKNSHSYFGYSHDLGDMMESLFAVVYIFLVSQIR